MKRNPSHLVDELLVLRCQDGDVKALDLLVDHCQKLFWSHALHLTQDKDAAWEVTQEAWLAIIRSIARLEDPALFRPWAYKIITFKAADWIKRRRTDRDAIKASLDADPPAQPAADNIDAADILLNLPEKHRSILTLRYLEEMDVDEIKSALNIPAGTVKSRLFHARNALRNRLNKGEGHQ